MSEPLRFRVLRASQPAGSIYLAAVPASQLLEICQPLAERATAGVFDRESNEPILLTDRQVDDLLRALETPATVERGQALLSAVRDEPYQRLLDRRRAGRIADYYRQPTALLPNAVILAVNVSFDEDAVVVEKEDGLWIELPRERTSATILDGQHRVAGFELLQPSERDRYEVAVSFLVGLPFFQQAELFAVINGEQKKVNQSIIFDLFGYAPLDASRDDQLYQGMMAVERFCSHTARILNELHESPWRGQIKMRGPGSAGLISQAAVVEYLSALVEPKTFSKRLRILPVLHPFFSAGSAPKCAALVAFYLLAVAQAQPEAWARATSLLWKNNGVAILMRMLHDHLILWGGIEGLKRAYAALVAAWQRVPPAKLLEAPKTGGGGVQIKLYDELRAFLFTEEESRSIGAEPTGAKRDAMEQALWNSRSLVGVQPPAPTQGAHASAGEMSAPELKYSDRSSGG